MDFIDNITLPIVSFAKSNPVVAFAVLAILVFFLYRRPKAFLITVLLGLVVIVVMFIVSDLSTSGKSKKEGLIEKSVPENSFRPHGLTF